MDILPRVFDFRFEVHEFAARQIDDLLAEAVADRARKNDTELFALVRHRIDAGMRAFGEHADAGLEHSGHEITAQVLQRQPHFIIFDGVAAAGAHDRDRFRAAAIAVDQEAQVFLERHREVDGIDQAGTQLAIFDLADGARRNAGQFGQAGQRQPTFEAQRLKPFADIFREIARAFRLFVSTSHRFNPTPCPPGMDLREARFPNRAVPRMRGS